MSQMGPFTIKTLSLEEVNRALRLMQMGQSAGVTPATPASIQTGVTAAAASSSSSTTIPVASFLTVTGEAALSASRKLAVEATLSLTDGGPLSSLTVGTAAFTGDVATPINSFVTTIQPNVVTNAKLAKMPTLTIKGNNTGLTADPLDLTTAQVTAMLDVFVASGAGHLKGLVPDPGGVAGTTKFLREDASWQTAVTSVGLSLPAEFTVAGSPVTTSGTLSATWASAAADTFFAAPQGSSGTPAFRTIAVGGDLSGTLPNPAVFQAHLTDQAVPAAPSAGTLILASFSQQGFSVPHIYDTQGNAIEITRDNITVVRNISGSTITKGKAVYITGSTGTVPTVDLAKADSASTMPAIGIMYDTTVSPGYGRVMLLGNIENFDLSAFANGNPLFVSAATAGALTASEPSAPNIPQFMGIVLNNGVGNGVMLVHPGEGEDESPVGTTLTSAHIWVGNASNVAADVAVSGDITLSNAGVVSVVGLVSDVLAAGAIKLTKIAAPGTPSLGTARLYSDSVTGNLSLKADTGTIFSGVVPASAPTHEFMTGIGANGGITFAQPTTSDISGLGTIATQNANNVAITGGAIDGTVVGGTTAAAGTFTTLIGSNGTTTSTWGLNANTISGTLNGVIDIELTNLSNGASAFGGFRCFNDQTLQVQIGASGSGRTATRFGITSANYGEFLTLGASTNGMFIGVSGQNKPIIIGINTSEVARFSTGTLASGVFSISYTLDATTPTAAGVTLACGLGVAKSIYGAKSILSTGPTSGVGYATGAGGTITQNTNKATGVTLNTVTGTITMNNANLAADTSVAFTLTNSAIAATDAVFVIHESAGTLGAYGFASTAAAGSAVITVHNNTPGALAEAIVLRFVVFKSVNA